MNKQILLLRDDRGEMRDKKRKGKIREEWKVKYSADGKRDEVIDSKNNS